MELCNRPGHGAARSAGGSEKSPQVLGYGQGVERSAPVGPIHPVSDIGAPGARAITLKVNGETRLSSTIDKLIWNIEELIAYLSRYFTLQPGAPILTGMPAGVAAIVSGEAMEDSIEGLRTLRLKVVQPSSI